MRNVQELPKQFTGGGEVSGFLFTQLEISDFGHIYEVNNHFEVFERKTTAVCVDFKKKIFSDTEFKVRYPKAKDFGIWAFSVGTMERARELLKSFEDKKDKH